MTADEFLEPSPKLEISVLLDSVVRHLVWFRSVNFSLRDSRNPKNHIFDWDFGGDFVPPFEMKSNEDPWDDWGF